MFVPGRTVKFRASEMGRNMRLYPIFRVGKQAKGSPHLARLEEVAFASMAVVKLNLSIN